MNFLRLIGAASALLPMMGSLAAAQSWQPLAHQPGFSATAPMLLTDGTVLVQDTNNEHWYKLTPDASGSYVNGTWSTLASTPGYGPLYYASAVLADGRVVVIGGEYNESSSPSWTNLGQIYDPVANTWASLPAPAGWANIGDAECAVLPNGKFLLANPFDQRSAVLDPATLAWTPVGTGKADRFDEEGWTLLPSGNILTADAINAPNTELLNTSTFNWTFAGNTPQSLEDPASQEVGPSVLRPDGTVVFFGATTHNAIYNSNTATWSSAPDFPDGLDVADGPAALLPNGNVLVCASPGIFNAGMRFFEWNGTSLNEVPKTPLSPYFPSYSGAMLVLPNGQVMFTTQYNDVEIYTPAGGPQNAWRPTVSSVPSNLAPGTSYTISGTQFNGLSQAQGYGDDVSNATNYPLVRITNNATGHVFYARTSGHSSMAVATGGTIVSTHFAVPAGIELGASTLAVVANGIPSTGTAVTIANVATDAITSLSPSSALVGSSFTLNVYGTGFEAGAQVKFYGQLLPTTVVNSGQLQATVTGANTTRSAQPGSVLVVNSNATTTNSLTFNLLNPRPLLTSISPSVIPIGSGDTVVTVNGTGLVPDSKVLLLGVAYPTTYVSPTQLTVALPASLFTRANSYPIRVTNPANGGGSSLMTILYVR